MREILVKDVCVLDQGDLEFYVARSKTDPDRNAFVFYVSGERYRGFSIRGVLDWYLASVKLDENDYLFPRFCNAEKGRIVA